MAAHRYWRATAFEAYGAGDLELSEFHLIAGGARVDATATLTASVAPDVSGVIANLQDDVLTTSARWSAQGVKGLALTWDYGGSTADVDDIRLAGNSEWRFPLIVKIEWSDDAIAWVDLQTYAGISWPGPGSPTGVVTSTGSADPYASNVVSLLTFEGSNGSTVFTDQKDVMWVASGAASLSTTVYVSGFSSLALSGATTSLRATDLSAFAFGTGDFCIEFWVYRSTEVDGGVGNLATYENGWYGINIWMFSDGSFRSRIGRSSAGTFDDVLGVGSIPLSVWTHMAVSRSGTTVRLFKNGTFNASGTSSRDLTATDFKVGTSHSGSYSSDGLSGFIDDLRITKGAARYTANFVAPSDGLISTQAGILRNTVMGRASPSEVLSMGTCPIITYGTPQIALPDYLSIESGSVKDQITGVLGEGVGRVKGTVATKGSPNQPAHRKVRLIRERDGLVIREAWSNAATGEYDFQYVDEAQTYTVVSYDHLHNYRAVIADNLTPELMP